MEYCCILITLRHAETTGRKTERAGVVQAKREWCFVFRVAHTDTVSRFFVAHTSTVGVKVQTRVCMYMYNNTGCRQIGNGRAYVYM